MYAELRGKDNEMDTSQKPDENLKVRNDEWPEGSSELSGGALTLGVTKVQRERS